MCCTVTILSTCRKLESISLAQHRDSCQSKMSRRSILLEDNALLVILDLSSNLEPADDDNDDRSAGHAHLKVSSHVEF